MKKIKFLMLALGAVLALSSSTMGCSMNHKTEVKLVAGGVKPTNAHVLSRSVIGISATQARNISGSGTTSFIMNNIGGMNLISADGSKQITFTSPTSTIDWVKGAEIPTGQSVAIEAGTYTTFYMQLNGNDTGIGPFLGPQVNYNGAGYTNHPLHLPVGTVYATELPVERTKPDASNPYAGNVSGEIYWGLDPTSNPAYIRGTGGFKPNFISRMGELDEGTGVPVVDGTVTTIYVTLDLTAIGTDGIPDDIGTNSTDTIWAHISVSYL
jgi:hypothetical protein